MGLTHRVFDLAVRTGDAVYKRAVLPWARHFAHRVVDADSLRAVLDPTSGYGYPSWSVGQLGDGRPAMQVHANWTFTNLTDKPVKIASVHIRHPRASGTVYVRHTTRETWGPNNLLPPHLPLQGSTQFWIAPPVRRRGKDLKVTVVFVDNLGNECPVSGVVFKAPSH